ncbi:MAG: hypothetical protein WC481_01410 [Candidatus Omnitrophota bacterium]
MFYSDKCDKELRFGDVLKGFISTTPFIKEPILKIPHNDYKIDIQLPSYCVVLSPCCSIKKNKIDKQILLSPLIQIIPSFFNNQYFIDDLTRINRTMNPEQTVARHTWEALPTEQKQKRLEKGAGYAFIELFIYEPNDYFPKYIVNRKEGNIETGYYMIDFGNTYKINCEALQEGQEETLLEAKLWQLSVKSRQELRDKITCYYGRIPEEDKALMGD